MVEIAISTRMHLTFGHIRYFSIIRQIIYIRNIRGRDANKLKSLEILTMHDQFVKCQTVPKCREQKLSFHLHKSTFSMIDNWFFHSFFFLLHFWLAGQGEKLFMVMAWYTAEVIKAAE